MLFRLAWFTGVWGDRRRAGYVLVIDDGAWLHLVAQQLLDDLVFTGSGGHSDFPLAIELLESFQ
jgi:hypothetical protein